MKFRIFFIFFICCATALMLIDYVEVRGGFAESLSLPVSRILNVHIDKMRDVWTGLLVYCFVSGMVVLYEKFVARRKRLAVCDFLLNIFSCVFDALILLVFLALLFMQCLNFLTPTSPSPPLSPTSASISISRSFHY